MNRSSSVSQDVIVVGGGVIGCALALRLAQKSLRVSVFDRGKQGSEASGAAAGMIAPQGETIEPDEFYYLCAMSRDLYPEFVAEVEELSDSSVNLRREGTLLAAIDEAEAAGLERIYEGQSSAGLPLERLSPDEARRRVPQLSTRVLNALYVPGDYWLDNERLTAALQLAGARCGVTFHPDTPVQAIHASGNRIDGVLTNAGFYSAGLCVLAAGAWSGEVAAPLGLTLPVRPCRGQMIEFEGADPFPITVRAGHHYLVPRACGRLVAGSTMEYTGYDKSVTAGGLRSILEAAERIAPCVKNLRFRRAWAGLRPDTSDHRPILGRTAFDNLFVATGHFRNGILLTPVTARLMADLIVGESTSLSLDSYSPQRFGC
jgi:glycine oxidase